MDMNKLLIVHGYSDRSDSFTELANLLRRENLYHDIRSIDYDSIDDEATFQDYADRLDDIYRTEYGDSERIDVLCHSTGSLVVRAWLALRRQRQLRYAELTRTEPVLDVPVERLYMFAPANFGSDIAKLGQSFWNRIKQFVTVGKEATEDGDSRWEVGKKVLQGLEPASPDQWFLSHFDLHGKEGKDRGYFGIPNANGHCCYPFVFAAGGIEPFVGDRFLSEVIKPGTDMTVRICGTSLNTRKCKLVPQRDLGDALPLILEQGNKVEKIPFAVFYDLNHTSIIGGRLNPGDVASGQRKQLDGSWSPLHLLRKASQVSTVEDYAAVAEEFAGVDKNNHDAWKEPNEDLLVKFEYDRQFVDKLTDRYQQIFFRFLDDVDDEVLNTFIDFYVYNSDNSKNVELTKELDRILSNDEFYTHSANSSHRVLLFNFDKWETFRTTKLVPQQAKVILEILPSQVSSCAYYERCRQVIYDPAWSEDALDGNRFFYPNTTTLVEVVLNRKQRPGLMQHKGKWQLEGDKL
jgi:hypothetical protein